MHIPVEVSVCRRWSVVAAIGDAGERNKFLRHFAVKLA